MKLNTGKAVMTGSQLSSHQFVMVDPCATREKTITVNRSYPLNLSEKTKESEALYYNIIKDLPVAVYTCDKNGFVQIYNKAAAELWGREPQIGKDQWCGSWKIYNPDGSPLALDKCPMAVTLKKGHAVAGEEIIIERPDGEKRYILPHPQPVFDDKGKIQGAINTLIEITGIKRSQQEKKENEERFHFIADSMPQKVWTADPMGKINYFNKKWLEYTGLSVEELTAGWKSFIHQDDWEENKKRWQQSIQTGNHFEFEQRLLNREGQYKWHLSRGLPYSDEDGKIKMWIGSDTEIQRVKEEEQRKGNFIKMVSHELKTPVTSIKGYVQLLLMMMDEKSEVQDPSTIRSSLVRIDKQVWRLTRLITEMLDLSRIEAGKLELKNEVLHINDLVLEVVEDMRHTSPKHVIEISNDIEADIYADRSRIEQVIINFLANAIKYSSETEIIKVRIHKKDKDQVAVSIKDHGIGIDKTDHEKIFERFYRVSGKSEQTYPGFGIGLFIAKTIIERHNGSISIESEKGNGSIFTFSLPISGENNI